jgi:hypothetical protein
LCFNEKHNFRMHDVIRLKILFVICYANDIKRTIQ